MTRGAGPGRRTVPFFDIINAERTDHLERLDPDNDQALVFTSPMGTPLRHSSFYRRAWLPAVAKVGLPGIHFHDLRHAGNTLTADAGASLRELMDRMSQQHPRRADLSAPVRRKAAEARRYGWRGRPGSTPQDGDIIWHTRGTRGQRAIVNVCRRSGYVSSEQVFQRARSSRLGLSWAGNCPPGGGPIGIAPAATRAFQES